MKLFEQTGLLQSAPQEGKGHKCRLTRMIGLNSFPSQPSQWKSLWRKNSVVIPARGSLCVTRILCYKGHTLTFSSYISVWSHNEMWLWLSCASVIWQMTVVSSDPARWTVELWSPPPLTNAFFLLDVWASLLQSLTVDECFWIHQK